MELRFELSLSKVIKNVIPILFVLSIFIKIQADLYFYSNYYYPTWSNIRHILFSLILFLLFILYIGISERKKWIKPMLIMLFFSLLYLAISIVLVIIQKQTFIRAFEVTFMRTIPILISYFFVNVYSKREINIFMRTLFLILSFKYIIDYYSLLLTPENWRQINFFQSYSPFESSAMSGYFYGFVLYFCLFDTNNLFKVYSFIMNFLVFKRINVLFSILLFLLGRYIPEEKKIKNSTKWFLIALFTILPIAEYNLILGEGLNTVIKIFPQFDLQGLLMGRDWFLRTIVNSNYQSYGLGSLGVELYKLLLKTGLELDGVQMYMELGIIGTFGISYTWWNFTERYFKNVIIVLLFMINYLTSAQLGDSYAVFFNTLTIAMISIYSNSTNREGKLN